MKRRYVFYSLIIFIASVIVIYLVILGVKYTSDANIHFDHNDVLMLNTYNVKYNEEIDEIICKLVRSRGLDKFIVCNRPKGYYFDYEKFKDTELKVREFITLDLTRIVKKMNNDTVYFINDNDTLKVKYKIFKPNLALWDGVILK
jgi:hypothetical protein